MLITRSPLRISLGGGGTDLPSYYSKHGGFLIAGAIDKYVYINIHKTFQKEYLIKYSKLEKVEKVDEIVHPIIRESLLEAGLEDEHVEISSMADIPAGTGLGSSGSDDSHDMACLWSIATSHFFQRCRNRRRLWKGSRHRRQRCCRQSCRVLYFAGLRGRFFPGFLGHIPDLRLLQEPSLQPIQKLTSECSNYEE